MRGAMVTGCPVCMRKLGAENAIIDLMEALKASLGLTEQQATAEQQEGA
jgi:non-homologous end joining protein Ku